MVNARLVFSVSLVLLLGLGYLRFIFLEPSSGDLADSGKGYQAAGLGPVTAMAIGSLPDAQRAVSLMSLLMVTVVIGVVIEKEII